MRRDTKDGNGDGDVDDDHALNSKVHVYSQLLLQYVVCCCCRW